MSEQGRWRLSRLWFAASVVCAVVVFDAGASLIYTYTDDQGNFVATDSLANVPPKYRARIKEREVQDSGPRAPVQQTRQPEIVSSSQASLESFVSWLVERFPKSLTIPGLTPGQSMEVVGGAFIGVLTIVAMLLSGNPFAKEFARLLLKFVLPLLAVGSMYLMYFSDVGERAGTASGQPGSSGNVMQKARDSAKAQEAAQQQRMKEIESLEQPMQVPK